MPFGSANKKEDRIDSNNPVMAPFQAILTDGGWHRRSHFCVFRWTITENIYTTLSGQHKKPANRRRTVLAQREGARDQAP
tara:strand:- start:291 stop:530 length:240 start_codon:yes stop_codon:yes gene_type:complete